MKKSLFISIALFTICASACKKSNDKTTAEEPTSKTPVTKNYGPYGKTSEWKSVGGDTIYEDELTLAYFYTEKNSPCNICYYQQNYSLWTDYDYTLSISECAVVNDTLIMTDIDTGRKAIFKREK